MQDKKSLMESFYDTFRRHKTIASLTLGMTVVGLALQLGSFLSKLTSNEFEKWVNLQNTGSLLFLFGLSGLYLVFALGWFSSRRAKNFSDIDEERKAKVRFYGGGETQDLVAELQSLRHSTAIDYGKIEEIIKKTQPKDDRSSKFVGSFDDYFNGVIANLSARALDSDEKASLLLERGISYVKFGLWFYFVAIVVWQTLVHFMGFKPEYLYGMGTTSLLFLFIEFLSAWFLKQYRHFVDTATYLLKVKAIFDRYYLIYLALKGGGDPKACIDT
jgi:hypothetical protein